MLKARVLFFIVIAAFLSAPAIALSEYGHLLEQRQVDLLPLLVIPASCEEFAQADRIAVASHVPLQEQASSIYSLVLESQKLLLQAKRTALLQQLHWLATPNQYSYYLVLSYACHSQATASLQKAVAASKLALNAAQQEIEGLGFEAGNQSSLHGLAAQEVIAKQREEQQSIRGASTATPLAALFLSASAKTTNAWNNALASNTGIVEAVSENLRLSTELLLFSQEIAQARQQLQARILEERTNFEVASAVSKTRLEFIAEEELDAVADEWFAYLPSGKLAVSGSHASFRETVRSSRLEFEQAQALAQQAAIILDEQKQGWAGNSVELYASAAQYMANALANAEIAEERSYALEQSLSQSVLGETEVLGQKAQNASLANPFGAAYAYSVARQASLSYEELAGAPRGKKIKEFVALLKKLREAGEVAQQSPSFKWSIEFLEEQVAHAKRMQQAAANDGLETSFYKRQIEQAETALAELKESRSEDFELSTSLSQGVFDLSSSLQKEVKEKFSKLGEKLLLLNELKQFLSQDEREKLELYFDSFNEVDFYDYGSGATLGETGKWADAKLAELSARSKEIVAEHLREKTRISELIAPALLGQPAQAELFWSASHTLALNAQEKLSIELPQLKDATEVKLISASSKIIGIPGDSLELSSSLKGENHLATISLRKIISAKTSETTTSSATAELLEKRTTIQFSAKQAASVLFEKKAAAGATISAQTQNNFETFENNTSTSKTAVFSVQAREGENEITFVEQTPSPTSVSKSVSYDNATGKLSILYEISNQLPEQINGLELDIQENVACLHGKTTVSSNAAQSVEQKRNGSLLAMRLKGMGFAPMQKQFTLLEVECGSLSDYANSKLQELSANPQVLATSAKELSGAQAALSTGNFAAAAEIAAKIENNLQQAIRKDAAFQEQANALSSRAGALKARGEQLLNASLENNREEFSQAAQQAISSAGKAVEAIEITESLSSSAAGTANEQEQKRQSELVLQARNDLEVGEQALSGATQLLEQQVSELLRQCPANLAVSSSKASACASSKQLAWQAKEKLLLQKPGDALELLEKGKNILQEWSKERHAKLSSNKLLGEELAASSLNATALLEKSGKFLAGDGSEGIARRKTEFSFAIAAARALESELAKAQKISATFASGDEEKIIALDYRALQERNARLQNATAKLQLALGAVEALALREVDSAAARSREFGDAGTAQKVSKAKESLQSGSVITAFALASGVNQELARAPSAKQGGFGVREAVLAGSGITILILLAFVFTRKGDEQETGQDEIGEEIGKAIALSGQASAQAQAESNVQANEKQGEKRKPSYF